MKISIAVVLALSALSLAGCLNPDARPVGNFGSYQAPAASTESAAIKGTTFKTNGLLTHQSTTFLAAIDGITALPNVPDDAPIKITPRLHSLVLGYHASANGSGRIPVVLDAKPGVTYLIELEDRGGTVPLFSGPPTTGIFLYLQEEKSGTVVTDKVTDSYPENKNYFTPSTAPDASTIQPVYVKKFLDRTGAYVMAVDGAFVRSKPSNSAFVEPTPDITTPVKISPGLHALTVGIFRQSETVFPILFDVKPRTAYAFHQEFGSRHMGDKIWITCTIWIEDEATHAIAYPKVDVPLQYVPTL